LTSKSVLCAGVFWVITENADLSGHILLAFTIPCDAYGNLIGANEIPLNAKSGGRFGLNGSNISHVRVMSDGSRHYECFIDWEQRD
jgi:hypothetical protein